MIKARYIILSALAFFIASSTSLHAQGGCSDSPEAPTVVLMFIGAAGMFCGSSALRTRNKSLHR
jgi:XrtJ-associated TM-motif-TM protein